MYPPLAIATVAALLPVHWELRLRDLHAEPLDDADLAWAVLDLDRQSTLPISRGSMMSQSLIL